MTAHIFQHVSTILPKKAVTASDYYIILYFTGYFAYRLEGGSETRLSFKFIVQKLNMS